MNKLVIDGNWFKKINEAVSLFTAKDLMRPILTGIHLVVNEDASGHIEALDGCRLCRIYFKGEWSNKNVKGEAFTAVYPVLKIDKNCVQAEIYKEVDYLHIEMRGADTIGIVSKISKTRMVGDYPNINEILESAKKARNEAAGIKYIGFNMNYFADIGKALHYVGCRHGCKLEFATPVQPTYFAYSDILEGIILPARV